MDEILAKREDVLRLAAGHGASNLRVFGSVARGTDDVDSDIDFLVSYPKEYDLFAQIDLMNDLSDMFHRKVDVVEERSLHRVIKEHVLKEAKAI